MRMKAELTDWYQDAGNWFSIPGSTRSVRWSAKRLSEVAACSNASQKQMTKVEMMKIAATGPFSPGFCDRMKRIIPRIAPTTMVMP